jgi:hypothetical protein
VKSSKNYEKMITKDDLNILSSEPALVVQRAILNFTPGPQG